MIGSVGFGALGIVINNLLVGIYSNISQIFDKLFVFRHLTDKQLEQAGAELGQAQPKLGMNCN